MSPESMQDLGRRVFEQRVYFGWEERESCSTLIANEGCDAFDRQAREDVFLPGALVQLRAPWIRLFRFTDLLYRGLEMLYDHERLPCLVLDTFHDMFMRDGIPDPSSDNVWIVLLHPVYGPVHTMGFTLSRIT